MDTEREATGEPPAGHYDHDPLDGLAGKPGFRRLKVTIDYPNGEGKRTRVTDAETGEIIRGVRRVEVRQEYGENPYLLIETVNFVADIETPADIIAVDPAEPFWPHQIGQTGIAQDDDE